MTKTRVRQKSEKPRLYCPAKDCYASCANNSRERGRFLRRHGNQCVKVLTKVPAC